MTWSDSKTFEKWWQFFHNYIIKRTANCVIHILDNYGPHATKLVDSDDQITMIFLQHNVSSVCQPIDCGIIAMLKKNYWNCLPW